MSLACRLTPVFALIVIAWGISPAARADDTTPSALEKNPAGWVDLMADAGPTFKGWSRGPIPPGPRPLGLVTPSQWSLDTATGQVHCKGNGGHEWIRWDKELGDGIFHVEWRFVPVVAGKTNYNSGVFVRNSADGTVWHQGQTGGGSGGFLFGATPKDGKNQPFNLASKRTSRREKPAGEWNTYEIVFKGSELTLWINGAVVNVFDQCGQPRGYVGLEAEGYEIEFRNVKLKALDH
jgi:hypothetical protein